jgi:hypothetical protein
MLVGVAGAVVTVDRWRHEDRVTVVGDSMAVLSADQLRQEGHAAGYDVTVNAVVGIPLVARLDVLRDVVAHGAHRVVVELGTNDVLQHTPPAQLDGLIDDAVTVLAPVDCVVFVNVGVLDDPGGLAAHFNEHLRDDLALHGNEHEYDWSSDYHHHPEWTDDTVHLQKQYWPLYAHAIIDTVRRACA